MITDFTPMQQPQRRLVSGIRSIWHLVLVFREFLVDPAVHLGLCCLADPVDPVDREVLGQSDLEELGRHWDLLDQADQEVQVDLWDRVDSFAIFHLFQVGLSLRVCHRVQVGLVVQWALVDRAFLVEQVAQGVQVGLWDQLGQVGPVVQGVQEVVQDMLGNFRVLHRVASYHLGQVDLGFQVFPGCHLCQVLHFLL